ncbi:hypothetical protein DEO72_LG1g2058 [Vigna unguiculata]|uniref:Uncharacterized protein n=1 Tax=Vigna unguiculata TaxID=3917 RepID=A0A4D6KPC3_VIGUN|nr:hypothetical protein DEO72_LG1g2058 [Vigna unguiculata]
MRTLGYITTKLHMIKELSVGLGFKTLVPSPRFSYATEARGLWILKGYSLVMNMKLVRSNAQKSQFCGIDAKESIPRYALAHHQLEAHVQIEYTVGFCKGFIQVRARLDNTRLELTKSER